MRIEEIHNYQAVTTCNFGAKRLPTGNGIMLFLVAVLFCKITGIRHINGNPVVCILRSFTTTDGITVWGNGSFPFTKGVYSSNCFFSWAIPICSDFNLSEVAATFRHAIVATLPAKNIPSDTVVMSIRGGDIIHRNQPKVQSDYWQPPCSFYTDVQKMFKNTIVYSADFLNPCVNVTLQNGAVFGSGDFMDAIASFVWAENFVISRSSFARAALYLSAVKKNFYVFEGDPDSINGRFNKFFYRFLEHGDHWNCWASKEYRDWVIPKGMGNWSASPNQLESLLRDRCTWTRVTIANRSWVPRPPSAHDIGWSATFLL
jgi:hypothetical protein